MIKKFNEFWEVLSEHSLYYPRDLRVSALNAATYPCHLARPNYDVSNAEALHHKYLNASSQKLIDFVGEDILKLDHVADSEERIYLPYDP